jgi:hypothetical protein
VNGVVVDEASVPWAGTGNGCWTHDHLLRSCEGYLVDGPDGHLGFVSEVVESGETLELVVGGTSGQFRVPLDAITYFDPRAERITIDLAVQ